MPPEAPMPAIPVPPWVLLVQAHADKAELDLAQRAVAKDIADAAYDDVAGPRRQTHRRETP